MKEFKEEILRNLNEDAKELTTVHFFKAMRKVGYERVGTPDTLDIVKRFLQENPSYKAYDSEDVKGILCHRLFFSECEFDS